MPFKASLPGSFTLLMKGAIVVIDKSEARRSEPQHATRRRPTDIGKRRAERRRALLGSAASAIVAGLILLVAQAISPTRAAAAGWDCETAHDCRIALRKAQSLAADCWLLCKGEQDALDAARARFRAAFEREAEAAALHERRAEEHRAAERQAAERRIALQAAHQEEVARERAHQRRLELLVLEQQAALRAEQYAEQRELAYLEALSPKQRIQRLRACYQTRPQCSPLAAKLVSVAASGAERQHLVNMHEEQLLGSAADPTQPEPATSTLPAAPNPAALRQAALDVALSEQPLER